MTDVCRTPSILINKDAEIKIIQKWIQEATRGNKRQQEATRGNKITQTQLFPNVKTNINLT